MQQSGTMSIIPIMCQCNSLWTYRLYDNRKKTNSDLTDDDVFNGVAKFPVTKFMTEDSQDL